MALRFGVSPPNPTPIIKTIRPHELPDPTCGGGVSGLPPAPGEGRYGARKNLGLKSLPPWSTDRQGEVAGVEMPTLYETHQEFRSQGPDPSTPK